MKLARRSWLKAGGIALASVKTAPPLLSTRALAAEPAAGPKAPFAIRECYCPAHFGNSYEAMRPGEMAAYLAEIKAWGFNRYGDWITTTDMHTSSNYLTIFANRSYVLIPITACFCTVAAVCDRRKRPTPPVGARRAPLQE